EDRNANQRRLTRRADGAQASGIRADVRRLWPGSPGQIGRGSLNPGGGVPDGAEGRRPRAPAGVHAELPPGTPPASGPVAEVPGGRWAAERDRPAAAGRPGRAAAGRSPVRLTAPIVCEEG